MLTLFCSVLTKKLLAPLVLIIYPIELRIWQQFLQFVETYVFADWKFLTFLGVLMGIDLLLGLFHRWQLKIRNYKLFTLLAQKLALYSCFLVLVHILAHFTIGGKPNIFFSWFDDLAYAGLLVRESIVILEMMGTVHPGLIPEWVLKKLKQYDKNGHFEPQPPK